MGELTLVGGLAGEHVVLRPVAADDVPMLLHIISTPEVKQWWDPDGLGDGWLLEDSSTTRYTILAGRRIAGLIQYWEVDNPRDRHAGIEILLDPDLHGRGLGRDAVGTLARHLFDACDHHRIVVETAATNEVAIRCYAAVGFRPVGMLTGRDGFVMDLLSSDFA
ncbi:GNAT family N-acetyltransferase [Jiangella rhizosphaerae]|uniref:N-acetyltransferase n=1 Tax=Jiangella rhizosphaerae TaxID=2293569 RepID=A0A418KKE0_9ACTN|nr:GNAT family protein [Jiangella rhizosphaerae]RIQ15818.1 N-acetyltransferase [Jiangella rhizosphaerae]